MDGGDFIEGVGVVCGGSIGDTKGRNLVPDGLPELDGRWVVVCIWSGPPVGFRKPKPVTDLEPLSEQPTRATAPRCRTPSPTQVLKLLPCGQGVMMAFMNDEDFVTGVAEFNV